MDLRWLRPVPIPADRLHLRLRRPATRIGLQHAWSRRLQVVDNARTTIPNRAARATRDTPAPGPVGLRRSARLVSRDLHTALAARPAPTRLARGAFRDPIVVSRTPQATPIEFPQGRVH